MRDTIQTKEYFDESIAFYQMVIDRDKGIVNNLKLHSGRAMQVHHLRSISSGQVIQCYSRGDDLKDMRLKVTQMAMMFKLLADTMPTLSELTPEEREMWANLGLSEMLDFFTCLAFLVALGYSSSQIMDAISWINHKGEDGLLDRLFVLLGDKNRDPKPEAKFARQYQPMVELIDAKADQRPKLLKAYVKSWYNRLRKASWHNTHDSEAYCGYWCFEAALVVMLLNIDDTDVKCHIHYPVDLVNYYRSNRQSTPVGMPK